MVGTAHCVKSFLALTLLLVAPLLAQEIPQYRLGDMVIEDITTPVPLKVVDPDATEALKQQEMMRVPAIFRFHPGTADDVDNNLRAAFDLARSNFLAKVEANFGRSKLQDAGLASPRFRQLLTSFQKTNMAFPVRMELAELWARGDSGSVILTPVAARVREVMERHIRVEPTPVNARLGNRLRLVTLTNREQDLTLETVKESGVVMPRTNVMTLMRARNELQALFPPEERALGKFAASLLQPNCTLDIDLTQQSRALQADPRQVADTYEAGQIIASAGQMVDAKILAALEQLQEKTAMDRLQQQMAETQARSAQVRQRNQWLGAGLALVTVLLLGLAAWAWTRRKRTRFLLPAKLVSDAQAAVISCPACDQSILLTGDVESWQRRAESAQAAIRAGLLTQLGRLLRERLVSGLVSQRKELLDAQQVAAAELAELERRLDDLRTPLKERLLAYEKRIAELEEALEARAEENRELIKAKIRLTRQQLEAERARNQMVLN